MADKPYVMTQLCINEKLLVKEAWGCQDIINRFNKAAMKIEGTEDIVSVRVPYAKPYSDDYSDAAVMKTIDIIETRTKYVCKRYSWNELDFHIEFVRVRT
jgi:hypothetical protein